MNKDKSSQPKSLTHTGLSKVTIYRYLRTFVDENPKVAEQMRKSGTSITPEDYKKLQEENARLHSELKREKLRADFYEEMVAVLPSAS